MPGTVDSTLRLTGERDRRGPRAERRQPGEACQAWALPFVCSLFPQAAWAPAGKTKHLLSGEAGGGSSWKAGAGGLWLGNGSSGKHFK